jgi:hypothetical protein
MSIENEINSSDTEGLFSRRQWLTRQAILGGAPVFLAIEAVASVAIEHPDWNMDEEKTWADWERATK